MGWKTVKGKEEERRGKVGVRSESRAPLSQRECGQVDGRRRSCERMSTGRRCLSVTTGEHMVRPSSARSPTGFVRHWPPWSFSPSSLRTRS